MITADGARVSARGLRYALRLGFSAIGLLTLLAGCNGASQSRTNHAGNTTGVFVSSVTQWQSADPSTPVYLTVSALDPDTGKPRWQHREEYHPYHQVTPVTVANGVVYMVNDTNTTSTDPKRPWSGDVIALNASDGSTRWRTQVGSAASAPLLNGNTIYVTAQFVPSAANAKVAYALNANDGSIRWQTPLPTANSFADSLALSNGKLVIDSNTLCFDQCGNVDIYAVDLSDGHLAWHQTLMGSLKALTPITDGNRVYLEVSGFFGEDSTTSTSCHLIAYDTTDGRELWRHETSDCDAIVSDGAVYAAEGSGVDPLKLGSGTFSTLALDGTTGAQRFKTPADANPHLLAVNNGQLYTLNRQANSDGSTAEEEIAVLDAANGALLWKKSLGSVDVGCQVGPDAIYSSFPPTSKPGQGTLRALDLSNGSQLWSRPIGSATESSLGPSFLIPPGKTIFVFDDTNGSIYALRATDGAILWSFVPPPENFIQGLTVAA